MKQILLIISLLLFIASSVIAQSEERLQYSGVVAFPGYSKDSLRQLSIKLCEKDGKSLSFLSVTNLRPAWANRRAEWKDEDFKSPGTILSVDSNELFAASIMMYEGIKDGCIKFLTIQSKAHIEVKDEKIKITFTDFTYTNKTFTDPAAYASVGGDGHKRCANSGSFEKLISCTDCDMQLEQVLDFTKSSANDFIDKFHTRVMALSKETAHSNNEEKW